MDDKGFVYIRIDKGMYGLPQAGILANQLLPINYCKNASQDMATTPSDTLPDTGATKPNQPHSSW